MRASCCSRKPCPSAPRASSIYTATATRSPGCSPARSPLRSATTLPSAGPAPARSSRATSRMLGRTPAAKPAASCSSTPRPPPAATSRSSWSAPPAGGRSRHHLARPKDAHVITKRDGRGLGAAADLGEACQLGPACPQLVWRAIDRVPGGPELDGAAERGPAVPPDPDRWVRLLQRFGLEDEAAELRVLTSKRRRPAGPKLVHRLQIFIGHGAALRKGHAQRGALGGHPTRADPKNEAAATERVERRDHLGRNDRIPVRDDEDCRPESDSAGRPGKDSERHERVEYRLAEIDDVGVRHDNMVTNPDGGMT